MARKIDEHKAKVKATQHMLVNNIYRSRRITSLEKAYSLGLQEGIAFARCKTGDYSPMDYENIANQCHRLYKEIVKNEHQGKDQETARARGLAE